MSDFYSSLIPSIFQANAKPGTPESYPALQMRQRIAMQLLARQNRPYPKTIGEGLASIGNSIGDVTAQQALQGLMAQEYARQAGIAADANRLNPPAASAAPIVAPGQRSEDTTQPAATPTAAADTNLLGSQTAAILPSDTLTPPATAPTDTASADKGVSDGGYNVQDAYAANNFKSPGGLVPGNKQDAIAAVTSNPNAQAYLAQLHAGEGTGTSSTGARGPFQFTPGTGTQYGLVGPNHDIRDDPVASGKATLAYALDNSKTFQQTVGRKPTYSELALMHQQGGQTGADMVAGTGNASPLNLARNRVPPNSTPAQAVARIKAYYGMGDQTADLSPGSRDSIAATAMTQNQAPDAQDAQLADTLGMGGTAGPSYPPTASRGDITSDAPQPGLVPRPMGTNAGAVPNQGPAVPPAALPINPIMPGAAAPLSGGLQPAPAGVPPEALNNRPIATNIQPLQAGQQFAQNIPPARPSPMPNINAPSPGALDIAVTGKPADLEMPKLAPIGPQQMEAMRKSADLTAQGDSLGAGRYDAIAKQWEQQRQEAYQTATKRYELQRPLYDQMMMEYRRSQTPEGQAAIAEANAKASTSADEAVMAQRAGVPAADIRGYMATAKQGAQRDKFLLSQLSLANEALQNGIVSGVGGQFKLNTDRLKTWMGNNPTARSEAANSQIFLDAVNQTVANALSSVQPGETRLTGAGVRLAQGMTAADLSREPETLKALLNSQMGDVRGRLDKYEADKLRYVGGLKSEPMYDVPIDPLHANPTTTSSWINGLFKFSRENSPELPEAIKQFNDRFGAGAAELELHRAARAAQRKQLGYN